MATNLSSEGPVGLVAGWGNFPVEVAAQLRARSIDVVVVALKGHADPVLQDYATSFCWQGILQIGAHMRFFERAKVKNVVLAGKLFKDRILYHGRGWIAHLPDLTCIRVLGGNFITKTRDGRDDSVLHAIVTAYEQRGMTIMPITEIAPSLLAPEGCLTRRRPTRAELLDINFGWQIARDMGGLDIGQSVTIRDQVVLGVEAIEGTDALIRRTGALCPRGKFTLVKVAKPAQDMRFDVPTIGVKTVQQLARAGGSAIAIEAGRTILVDREETLKLADRHGIKIVALRNESASSVDHSVASRSFEPAKAERSAA